MSSAKTYEVRSDDGAVDLLSPRGKVIQWPTKALANGGIMKGDGSSTVERKGLAVFVTVSNMVCMCLNVIWWVSPIAAIVWGVFGLLSAVAALAVYSATKSLNPLRHWNAAAGILFFIIAFFGEGCRPLTASEGRILVPMAQSIIFLPAMGTSDIVMGVLGVTHLVFYVVAAAVDAAGGSCGTQIMTTSGNGCARVDNISTNSHGAYFGQLVLPLLVIAFTVVMILRRLVQQQQQDSMSENFGRDVIKAAQRNDVEAIEAAISNFDDSNPPNPSMSDDAIGVMIETVRHFKRLVPHDLGLSRRGSVTAGGFAATKRNSASPSPQFLSAPEFGAVETKSASGESVEDITTDEEKEADKARSRQNAIRRRSSRVALVDTDGEVSNPNPVNGFMPRGMSKGGAFIVAFSLPRLPAYASRGISSLDLCKLFMSEFVDHVHVATREYEGVVLFNSFNCIYSSFENVSQACAASVYLLDCMKKDANHHKDALLNETKAHKPFVTILHAELLHGTVGVDAVTSAGYSPADRVFNKIMDIFPNTTAVPPCIVVASSLKTIASEGFDVTDGPHPNLCFVEGAKSFQPDGKPVAIASGQIVTTTDEYTLPEFEDIPGEIANNIIEKGRKEKEQAEQRKKSNSQGTLGGSITSVPGQLANNNRPTTTAQGRRKRLPQEVVDVWNEFDRDGNGYLDVDEVRDMLEQLGMAMEENDLKAFFDEVDADHSGTVNIEEFQAAFFSATLGGQNVMAHVRRAAAAMASNTGGENLPIVLNAWKKYDADGSGSLESKELSMILADLGMPQTEEEVEWLVQKLDKNGNGSVDFDEFAALFSEDDAANKKLNAVKERIQTVSRVMQNKSSGKIYSNADQDLRDQRVAIGQFVEDYCYLPLFIYCCYNAGQNVFRCAMGDEMHVGLAHIVIDMVLDLMMIGWVLAKMFIIPIESKGQVIFHTKEILKSRMRTKTFWLDIAIIIPLDIIFIGSGVGEIGYWRSNKILCAYYLDPLYKVLVRGINPAVARAANAMLYFFMFSHVFGSLCIVCARGVGEWEMMDMVGTRRLLSDRDNTYLKSFYWAILTLAGQLKGEAIPDLEIQVVLLVFGVLVGLPMYTVVLGTIGNATNVEDSYTRFLAKIDDLRGYFEYTKLPKHFETECVAFYRHVYATTGSLDITEDPLDDLPVELSIQVVIQIGREMLKKVPIFASACNNLEFVHELTTKLVPKVMEPGTCVMRKGDRGSNMYFVTHGDFDIVIPGGIVVFTLRKGSFFGEIALLHNVKRTATIVCAQRYANVLILDKKHFDEVSTTFPECLSQVYKAAEDRIKQMLEQEKKEAAELKEKRRAEREEARAKAIEQGEAVVEYSDSEGSGQDTETPKANKEKRLKRVMSTMASAMVRKGAEDLAGGPAMANSQTIDPPATNGNATADEAEPSLPGSADPEPTPREHSTASGARLGRDTSPTSAPVSPQDPARPATTFTSTVAQMKTAQGEEEAFPSGQGLVESGSDTDSDAEDTQ